MNPFRIYGLDFMYWDEDDYGYSGYEVGRGLTGNPLDILRVNAAGTDLELVAPGSGTIADSLYNYNIDIVQPNSGNIIQSYLAYGTAGIKTTTTDANGFSLKMATAASIGSTAAYLSTAGAIRIGRDPIYQVRIITGSDITEQRMFFGLASAGANNADDPGSEFIGFRYSSAVGGNWYSMTDDGTTLNAQDSGVACSANTEYVLKFVVSGDGTSVAFYINGVLVETITTNLPAAATNLLIEYRLFAIIASARHFYLRRAATIWK